MTEKTRMRSINNKVINKALSPTFFRNFNYLFCYQSLFLLWVGGSLGHTSMLYWANRNFPLEKFGTPHSQHIHTHTQTCPLKQCELKQNLTYSLPSKPTTIERGVVGMGETMGETITQRPKNLFVICSVLASQSAFTDHPVSFTIAFSVPLSVNWTVF